MYTKFGQNWTRTFRVDVENVQMNAQRTNDDGRSKIGLKYLIEDFFKDHSMKITRP